MFRLDKTLLLVKGTRKFESFSQFLFLIEWEPYNQDTVLKVGYGEV